MNTGSCLCGSVAWAIDGPLQMMSHCHCSRCRKTHGAPFATYVAAPAESFRLRGEEHVVRWESMPGFFRCFCRRCGSVVPGDGVDGNVFVPAGNFDGDPGARPLAHIFAASKAPWYEIHDDLPRFETYPQGFDAPVLPDRPPVDPPGGTRGSCLCGGVAFVVEGATMSAWACHCGRCRKARSAAHNANLFGAPEALRFTRGQELLVSYKLPDAERFTQTFCRACGSCMPRVDPSRGIAIVPMGSLDDDPGVRLQAHIFVGSKAPWYEIPEDGIPRHDQYPTSV